MEYNLRFAKAKIKCGMKKYLFFIACIGFFSCKKEVHTLVQPLKITTGYGPEDMVLDESTNPARILISCNTRREYQPLEGEIYALNTADNQVVKLPREGEPEGLTLNPHGIDIEMVDGEWCLYVISHQSFNDSTHAVLKYKIAADKLIFEEIYVHPLLLSPNALTVMPDGSFYVSNDDGGGDAIAEQLFNPLGGTVIYFDSNEHWSKVAEYIRFSNGICALDKKLYLATSRNKGVFEYDIQADGSLTNKKELCNLDGWDNLRVCNGKIIGARHTDQAKFLRHSLSEENISPWAIYEINPENGDYRKLAENDGSIISGVSTGLVYNGKVYVCQIFESYIVVYE